MVGVRKGKWTTAVAYTRVSTVRQGESGVGLTGQMVAIEEYARNGRYELVERFQDVASGYGGKTVERRPGLNSAINTANMLKCPIVVSSMCRVARDQEAIYRIVQENGITFISTSEGVMINPDILASAAKRAEFERQVISRRTTEALAERKRQGVKLGNRTNLPEAQKKGNAANKAKADEVNAKIADVLESLGGREDLTATKIAAELNDRGVLTGRHGQWTVAALRRPLARARNLLKRRSANQLAKNPLYGRFG